jgi:protein ImuB
MALTLCVWYPEWSLGRPDAPLDEPVVVVEGTPARVVALRSTDGEVVLGMLRRQAEALLPAATVLERDRAEESRRFEEVIAAIEEVVPRVEVVEPGLALLPVAGPARYYGGDEALVGQVMRVIPPGGLVGLAEGPFAARRAAERAGPDQPLIIDDTAAFLAELDVEALGPGELVETFRWLGVTTLGALAALPRQAIASRFGELGLTAHRLASGEDRPPQPRTIPLDAAVESRHHEEPLVMADQVAFVTRGLAVKMLDGLRRQGISPYRVLVEVESADKTTRIRMWRSADPFTDQALAERVWWQVRAWMDTPGGVPGGLVRIKLDPSDLSDEGRQLALLEQVGSGWQEVGEGRHEMERALARAQALVGPDAVLQAAPQGGRMPHEQVRWYPWGEPPGPPARDPSAPWPGKMPAPSPALVSASPPLLEVEWDGGMPVRIRLGTRWEPVLAWSGPWRMTGRWWKGEPTSDRYQIVTSAGAVLCVVEKGRAYLAGVYD